MPMRLNGFLLCGALCLATSASAQRTIYVPDHYPSIQAAIDAAITGDTVIVRPGVYPENVRFTGKDLILQSTDPLNPSIVQGTVIDGRASSSVVTLFGTETSACRLEGFTIRNGRAPTGGGILGNRTHAAIQNNIITGNRTYGFQDVGTPRNLGDGGGIFGCDGLVQNNRITDNHATEDGGGLNDCDGTIQNNLIARNLANDEGGGLSGCDGVIQNNTIVLNRAERTSRDPRPGYGTYTAGVAGGLNHCVGSIRNCIIWGNVAIVHEPENYPPTVDESYECNDPSFSIVQHTPSRGVGNILADPRFAETVTFRLQTGSPCIDAGANFYWFAWPQRDLMGLCRLAGDRVDMGCHEYHSIPDRDGDLLDASQESRHGTNDLNPDTDGDGLRDGLEVLRGSNPHAQIRRGSIKASTLEGIQKGLCLAVKGDEIVVSPGTYFGSIQFCGVDVIVRSETPQDPQSVGATILDGKGLGPVVAFMGDETEASVLAGFTIRDGCGDHGGGVRGGTSEHHARALIEWNTISDNQVIRGGGGIAWCDGRIRNNQILRNSAGNDGGAISQCHGTIEYNVITDNYSEEDGGGIGHCRAAIQGNTVAGNLAGDDGGGLFECSGPVRDNMINWNSASGSGGGLSQCQGTIQGNTISGNGGKDGGGLFNCDGLIRNNVIAGNRATDGGGLSRCGGIIRNNRIFGNTAGDDGGGLHRCQNEISNNLIFENEAGRGGGGIAKCYGLVRNNTIVNNRALNAQDLPTPPGNGFHDGIGKDPGEQALIINCIIWGNRNPRDPTDLQQVAGCVPPEYSCIEFWGGGGGNLYVDPQLVGDDFRLSAGSPCIDAGHPDPSHNDASLPPGQWTVRNDMGAYGGPYNGDWDTGATGQPDLTGMLVSIGPNPIILDRPMDFTGGVINQGAGSRSSGCWVEFWAVGGSVTYLCDSLALSPLYEGESLNLATLWPKRTAYGSIPPGQYTIEMRIDVSNGVTESDESNNIVQCGPYWVLPDLPNLTVDGFDFSPREVSPAGGTPIAFQGRVCNNGSRWTTRGFYIEFRLWPDSAFQPTGPYLCQSFPVTGGLSTDEPFDLATITGWTTDALWPGTYYVGVVLDPLNSIDEQFENDNVVWISDKPLCVGPCPTHAARWRLYR